MIFVPRRSAGGLTREVADVVGDEPVHRRGLTRRRSIVRRTDGVLDLEAIVFVRDVVQLGWVRAPESGFRIMSVATVYGTT
jgi:hypothetical protein